ncbi:MAG: hypothetical protein R3Y59_02465 [bacterium]
MKLYYFNPEHDLAMANGDANFKSPEAASSMASDLSLLPCWYAREGAAVFSETDSGLEDNPLNIKVDIIPTYQLKELHPESVEPWGWDMAVRKFFLQSGVNETMLPNIQQVQQIKELSHRRIAMEGMDYLRSRSIFPNSFPPSPVEATSIKAIEEESKKYDEIVLKAPWSGSGKGVFWSKGKLTSSLSGWCKRVIEKQGSVMVEPAQTRVQDFAMEFLVENGTAQFAGYSLFFTEGSGVYRGNRLMSNEMIEDKLCQWVSREHIHWLIDEIKGFLTQKIAPYYTGYLGVDMFVYTQNDEYYINPMVEINLRMTMGMVARIFADKYLSAGAKGWFKIDNMSPFELLLDHNIQTKRYPLQMDNGRIKSGYLSLCPVNKDTIYRVYVVVEDGLG